MRARVKHVLSFLLLACGSYFLYLGARDLFDSRAGQYRAAREFEHPISDSSQIRSINPPPPLSPVQRGETVAKLTIPRLNAELYVVEGDGAGELRRGPGHLIGTAMPGGDGNCVIAGHRDTHFRVLKDVRAGDDIVLQTDRGQFLYRVRRTEVVTPDNTSALRPTSSAELNLITCYPFYYVGSAPRRFIVEAQLAGSVRRPS
jgi:sortase A